ncbi:DNA adenine methylase [Cellulosimicrobium funkei]|uniref:site-specific DNA-methyltransferase (adenine-specific) n=1 Tax=Cellulosimicrobium funkei TaxID=264251 RepID=A0A4Y8QYY2_9MICO|nr:DNA adenine methylase [Cellulosimicrobium funkei]TFF04448.1 DNA adenine methylase [Cellulosimicrobium funkei]TGA67887.1 DNA adenine methylase [Cellulosimicrobium terreum]
MTQSLRIQASRRYGTLSPLRYPGGKSALAGLFADLIEDLGLRDVVYVEPYAGGVGAGIALLREGLVSRLVINDIDPAVFAFWKSVTEQNEDFVAWVHSVPLTLEEWARQREVYRSKTEDRFDLGRAFFYLNRTNRSGVLNAGVIGGKAQSGKYKIDARFNRTTLAERLLALGDLADSIEVSELDGRSVILKHGERESTFMYIDPPYVQAGSQLYLNAFDGRDHQALARIVGEIPRADWLMTYDLAPVVERLYADHFQATLDLNYSARYPGRAEELVVASPRVAQSLMSLNCLLPVEAGA